MSTILHVGVFVTDRDSSRLAGLPLRTDGDSFVEWGETPRPGDPLHFTVNPEDIGGVTRESVGEGYNLLLDRLHDDERIVDYAVVTDASDWSEVRAVVTLLDGAITTVSPDTDDYDEPEPEPVVRRRWSPFRR